jgi:hypothetical protein
MPKVLIITGDAESPEVMYPSQRLVEEAWDWFLAGRPY